MPDPSLIFGRLALYVTLMAGFGLPLFALNFLRGETNTQITRRLLKLSGVTSVIGLLASVFGLWAMVRGMGGGDVATTLTTAHVLLTQTTFGTTWIARVVLLLLAIGVFGFPGTSIQARVLISAMLGAGALATLAWAGHGAMSEGVLARLHLGADIAHLLAAGAWFGALLAFILVARASCTDKTASSVRLLADTSDGFARLGSAIVGILLVSGTINYVLIVGPLLSGLFETTYGRLLLIKLGLFIGMLTLAAANRFRFSPALSQALREGDTAAAASTLQRSLRLESSLAFVVLVLVAGLGALDPSV